MRMILESLPKEIREQVLQSNELKQELEEPNYRRPDSSLELKESDETVLSRFGMRIFKSMQTSFMPVNEPNVDSEYILDFGDVLEIQLVGPKSYIQKTDIKRDGSISVKDLGKIFLSGLNLGDASDLIKSKVSSSFIGTEAFVSLVNIRDIQIFVLGAIELPGLYTLNGNANILQALNVAGGITLEGSFREIQHKSGVGDLEEEIDLYDLFINGNAGAGKRLRSGDVIFVKPALNIASIYGGVNRPLAYELKNDESIAHIIQFANGYLTVIKIEEDMKATIDIFIE